MSDRLLAFPYYGGKYSHLGWLLPLLPTCHHYVEPFGGSAAVLLNRRPSPLETYNDLDGDVVNFFRVLREQPDELERQLRLTPFSREEYTTAVLEPRDGLTPLERARRFYVRTRQGRMGMGQIEDVTAWGFKTSHSRRGMAGGCSHWLAGPDTLAAIAERLTRVQIECADACSVIERYDTPATLFYCDPPYVHSGRVRESAYQTEMDDVEHERLSVLLKSVRGMVALSGYDTPLYSHLYAGWHRTEHRAITRVGKNGTTVAEDRVEMLWTNYDPATVARGQTRLPLGEETA